MGSCRDVEMYGGAPRLLRGLELQACRPDDCAQCQHVAWRVGGMRRRTCQAPVAGTRTGPISMSVRGCRERRAHEAWLYASSLAMRDIPW